MSREKARWLDNSYICSWHKPNTSWVLPLLPVAIFTSEASQSEDLPVKVRMNLSFPAGLQCSWLQASEVYDATVHIEQGVATVTWNEANVNAATGLFIDPAGLSSFPGAIHHRHPGSGKDCSKAGTFCSKFPGTR